MGTSFELDDEKLAEKVAGLRESLAKAGLVATDIEVSSNGQLIVPKGSLKFAAATESVATANPSDTQQVAASQLRISELYYQNVLDQARQSFRWALVAAIVGLAFFITAIGAAFSANKLNAALISASGGTIVEVISGLNFWLYSKTATQLDAFHVRLERMQRFLLANSVAHGLSDDERATTISDLVAVISKAPIENSGPSSVARNGHSVVHDQATTSRDGSSVPSL
jgi:hypothetical protein